MSNNGTVSGQHFTPLISHTANDIITALTGVYSDRSGSPVSNSYWPHGGERCFVPEGGLAPGDILLAQKIALETMEREALALANRQSFAHSPGDHRPGI